MMRKLQQNCHALQCSPLKAQEPPQDAVRRTMPPKMQAADRRIPAAVPAMQQEPPEMTDLPPPQDTWVRWSP